MVQEDRNTSLQTCSLFFADFLETYLQEILKFCCRGERATWGCKVELLVEKEGKGKNQGKFEGGNREEKIGGFKKNVSIGRNECALP